MEFFQTKDITPFGGTAQTRTLLEGPEGPPYARSTAPAVRFPSAVATDPPRLRSAAAEGDSMWVRKLLEERVDPAAKDGPLGDGNVWTDRERYGVVFGSTTRFVFEFGCSRKRDKTSAR